MDEDLDLFEISYQPIRQCPTCLSQRLYPSRAKTAIEKLLVKLGGRIRRCSVCNRRQVCFGMRSITSSDVQRYRFASSPLRTQESRAGASNPPQSATAGAILSSTSEANGLARVSEDEIARFKSRIALELEQTPKRRPMRIVNANGILSDADSDVPSTDPVKTLTEMEALAARAAFRLDSGDSAAPVPEDVASFCDSIDHEEQDQLAQSAVEPFQAQRYDPQPEVEDTWDSTAWLDPGFDESPLSAPTWDEQAFVEPAWQSVEEADLYFDQPVAELAPITTIAARLRSRLAGKNSDGNIETTAHEDLAKRAAVPRDLISIVASVKCRLKASTEADLEHRETTEAAPKTLQTQSA